MVYFVLVFENFTHGHHVYITPVPPMSSPPSPIHSLSFTFVAHIHIVCVHVHACMCVCMCVYDLPSPYSIAHMYMCPELTTWNWTAYDQVYLCQKLIHPFSAAIDHLYLFI